MPVTLILPGFPGALGSLNVMILMDESSKPKTVFLIDVSPGKGTND